MNQEACDRRIHRLTADWLSLLIVNDELAGQKITQKEQDRLEVAIEKHRLEHERRSEKRRQVCPARPKQTAPPSPEVPCTTGS